MGARGRPKGPRPAGWGPDFVLRWMELHPNGNIMPFLERLAADTPGTVAGSLYQEITRWKRKDPVFRERYRTLSDGRHPAANNTGGAANAIEARPGMEDWKVKAAMVYLETGSRFQVAQVMGIGFATLNNKLSKGCTDFDEELRGLFDQVDQIRLAEYEGLIPWALAEAKAQADVKTVLQYAIEVLGRLDRDKWSRREERTITGKIDHHHVHEVRQQRAIADAAEVSRRLFAPRDAVEVIEAEAVEVPHAASG